MNYENMFEKHNLIYSANLYGYDFMSYKELEATYYSTCLGCGLKKNQKAFENEQKDEAAVLSSKRKLAKIYAIKYNGVNEKFYGKMNEVIMAIEVFLAANEKARNLIDEQKELPYHIYNEFSSFIQTLINITKPKKTITYFDEEIKFDREYTKVGNEFRFYLKSF